jgi:hypothetical protein
MFVSWRASASLMITTSTPSDRANQRIARVLDPEVHRIERHELRVGHLFSHATLQDPAECCPETTGANASTPPISFG